MPETAKRSVTGTNIRDVPDHAGTDHGAPSDPEVTSVSEKQLRLLFTFPIVLGLFVCALNLIVVIRLWRAVYFSSIGLLSRSNLPNTVCFTLIAISFAIGLALIVYAIALRHYEEWYVEQIESSGDEPPEPPASRRRERIPSYIKWVLGPFIIALPAPALTVWAAATVEPLSPKPCIELYQYALTIKKDNPNFKMVWNDRDQLRCSINQVLEQ